MEPLTYTASFQIIKTARHGKETRDFSTQRKCF